MYKSHARTIQIPLLIVRVLPFPLCVYECIRNCLLPMQRAGNSACFAQPNHDKFCTVKDDFTPHRSDKDKSTLQSSALGRPLYSCYQ